jgi:diguanylate cyclase (GGDEF)-like protein
MNVADQWGSYNTGAAPIFNNGRVIGIVSADIDDVFVSKSRQTASANGLLLLLSMAVMMILGLGVVVSLLRQVRSAHDQLHRLANYDLITGLPNRQYLLTYLKRITSGDKAVPFALIFIDLDNFKQVNDNAGHDAGDDLLRKIAAYLDNIHENSKAFRPAAGILNVSARIGGDEFLQVVPGLANPEEAAAAAQKVLDNFYSPELDRFIDKYKVGLSLGVALFPYHSDNFNVLIKYADMAMYRAKNSGKNTYRLYEDEMDGGPVPARE